MISGFSLEKNFHPNVYIWWSLFLLNWNKNPMRRKCNILERNERESCHAFSFSTRIKFCWVSVLMFVMRVSTDVDRRIEPSDRRLVWKGSQLLHQSGFESNPTREKRDLHWSMVRGFDRETERSNAWERKNFALLPLHPSVLCDHERSKWNTKQISSSSRQENMCSWWGRRKQWPTPHTEKALLISNVIGKREQNIGEKNSRHEGGRVFPTTNKKMHQQLWFRTVLRRTQGVEWGKWRENVSRRILVRTSLGESWVWGWFSWRYRSFYCSVLSLRTLECVPPSSLCCEGIPLILLLLEFLTEFLFGITFQGRKATTNALRLFDFHRIEQLLL